MQCTLETIQDDRWWNNGIVLILFISWVITKELLYLLRIWVVYRLNISRCHWETIFWLPYFKIKVMTWSLHVLWNPRAWVYSLKNKGLPLKNFVKSKTEFSPGNWVIFLILCGQKPCARIINFKEYCIIFYLFQALKMS